MRIPNESAEYRAARTALLAEEIELRRHIERVAAQRRALPQGGRGHRRLSFSGRGRTDRLRRTVRRQADACHLQLHVRACSASVPVRCAPIFSAPGRATPRTSAQRVVARRRRALSDRAPDRLEERARLAKPHASSATSTAPIRATFRAIAADGTDEPALNVFTRRDGAIRHFWSDEMSGTSDPGQDPRGAPDPAPLWMVLDMTPEGRDPHWYPKLEYV